MISYGLVMVAVTVSWLYGLRVMGVHNAALQLLTTVALGAAVYTGLMLWRRPPVVGELSLVLGGSSRPFLKFLSRILAEPEPTSLGSKGASAGPQQA